MTPGNWRDLLATWSRDILAVEEYREEFPPEVVASGWLGFPPATADEIAATEARLGLPLPPSYRAFLAVTNGWRRATTFVERVRPVGEVAWYRDESPELLAAWLDGERSYLDNLEGIDSTDTTGHGLQAALAVSDYDDGQLLLVPQRIGADGEWPAWFFAPWVPGERAYDSFWDLIIAQHQSFLNVMESVREREEQG